MHRMSDSHSAVLMRAMRARRAPAREGGGEGEGGGGGGGAHPPVCSLLRRPRPRPKKQVAKM